MTKAWTRKQEKFQAWLATPDDMRDPPFQKDFGEMVGTHPVTLANWKKKPGFMDAVADLAESYLIDDMPAVLSTLRARAKRGDFQHMKLYLEMAGRYVDSLEVTGKGGGPLIIRWDDDADSD